MKPENQPVIPSPNENNHINGSAPNPDLDAGVLPGLLRLVELFPQDLHRLLQVAPLSFLLPQFLLLGSQFTSKT